MATKVDDDSAHAEFSASGSARWLNCPGSHALCKKAPPQPESPYALEGTKAHKCLEIILKNHALNNQAAVKKLMAPYSDDMRTHAFNAAVWILKQHLEHPGSILLSETKIDSSPFTCSGQFGTLDAAIVQEFGRLMVIDYKYGAGVAVDPVDEEGELNSQLAYYALGLSYQYNHNFTEVELVVIQPRAYHESGETIRSVVVPIDELLKWHQRFRDGVMATSDKDAPFKAGKWCKFCAAATICPELKDKAFKDAQIAFTDAAGITSLPVPTLVQLPNLGTILNACERLEDWIDKVRQHAIHVLERGEEIEGFKLVQKRATRKWADHASATTQARSKFGKLAFSEPELLSPAQLEKAAKGTKGLDEWIQARVTAESSGTTLVRSSDKRQAVKSIEAVFGALPGQIGVSTLKGQG
jgi:hypothetical protein